MHETATVAAVLREGGYEAETEPWGCHNTVITSITLNGVDCIPEDACICYDEPRKYLPKEVVDLLDAKLSYRGKAKP